MKVSAPSMNVKQLYTDYKQKEDGRLGPYATEHLSRINKSSFTNAIGSKQANGKWSRLSY